MTEQQSIPYEDYTLDLNPTTVEGRNKLQNSGRVHPYTCGNDDCRTKTNQAPLRATEDGWLCDHCGYTQKFRT